MGHLESISQLKVAIGWKLQVHAAVTKTLAAFREVTL
jgi:hypothetical protein